MASEGGLLLKVVKLTAHDAGPDAPHHFPANSIYSVSAAVRLAAVLLFARRQLGLGFALLAQLVQPRVDDR